MKTKGFTLLEVTVALTIACMVSLIGMSALSAQIKTMKRIEDGVNQSLQIYNNIKNIHVLNHCAADDACEGLPVLCLTESAQDNTLSCNENNTCAYNQTTELWERQTQGNSSWSRCSLGVIVRYELSIRL